MGRPAILQQMENLETNAMLKNNTEPFTPDSDYEPSTKKYTDDSIAAIKESGILINQTMDAGVTVNCGVRYHNIYGKWIKTQNAQGIYIGNDTVVLSGYVTLTTPLPTASNTYYLDASGNLTTTETTVEAGFSLSTTELYVDIEGALVETIEYIEQTFTASDTVIVPIYATKADVFLVGGGGGGGLGGGGGGYANTYTDISVTPEESISIIVGSGGAAGVGGSYSQFASSSYRALGGNTSPSQSGGSGGSGGGGYENLSESSGAGGSDGSDGFEAGSAPTQGGDGGTGQGTTTRAFGEPAGLLCSGGGSGGTYYGVTAQGGDGGGGRGSSTTNGPYTPIAGTNGLGGGGGGSYNSGAAGGSGRVIVRWKS